MNNLNIEINYLQGYIKIKLLMGNKEIIPILQKIRQITKR
jgi:hypothetical protein